MRDEREMEMEGRGDGKKVERIKRRRGEKGEEVTAAEGLKGTQIINPTDWLSWLTALAPWTA